MNPTYEKISETEGKIIKPRANITSLSSLKKELEDAIQGRERIVKNNIEKLNEIDTYISEIQGDIVGFENAGIKEDIK